MAGLSTTNRWKLGLFVTLGFATCLVVLGWISAHHLRRDTILIHYFFDEEVSGLDVGASVQFRGVKIGKVSKIRAAPDRRHVEVQAEIFTDPLEDIGLSVGDALGAARVEEPFFPDELRAQLRSSVLTGVTFIQLDFFDPGRYPEKRYPFEVPWNTVHTAPSAIKSIETGLLEMANRFPELALETSTTLGVLRREIETAEIGRLAQEIQRTARALSERLDEIERLDLLARTSETLEAGTGTLDELRALVAELSGQEGMLSAVAQPWQQAGSVLAEVLGDADLPETTRLLRELSAEMVHASNQFTLLVSHTRHDMDLFRETLEAVRRLADMLERDPASLLHGRSPSVLLPEIR